MTISPLTTDERSLLEDMTLEALVEQGRNPYEFNAHEFWGAPCYESYLADFAADILDSVDEMLAVCGFDSITEFRNSVA